MPPVGAGTTFFLPKPNQSTAHLWVVLTDPDNESPPHVAIVNLTSSAVDDTVILTRGDHPFVRHETYIYYEDAKIVPAQKLVEAVNMGISEYREEFQPAVLERVQDGLLTSPHVSPKVREYCRDKF